MSLFITNFLYVPVIFLCRVMKTKVSNFEYYEISLTFLHCSLHLALDSGHLARGCENNLLYTPAWDLKGIICCNEWFGSFKGLF